LLTSPVEDVSGQLVTLIRGLRELQVAIVQIGGISVEVSAVSLLARLSEMAPARPSALAAAMCLDLSTVSRQVPILERQGWVVRSAEASSLDRVVVVLGGAADDTRASLVTERAELVSNRGYASGCASSLLAGLDAVAGCDAAMLVLGDMPGVDTSVIDTVRADWERHRPALAVTNYRGALGHPFVFSAEMFPDLAGLHGDKAVWKLIEAEPERARPVAIDRPLPLDVDTWDDYLAVCRQLGLPAPA
jgi:molybdenum cofactor cytidylyltransferase